MSENTGWGDPVETRPVASAPVPTVEAQIARMRDHARDDRRSVQPDSPFLRRITPRRNPWPEVAGYDERARALTQRVATLNDEITAREEALQEAVQADREALTSWQLADLKRPRPEPTAPAIEREIEEKKADATRQARRSSGSTKTRRGSSQAPAPARPGGRQGDPGGARPLRPRNRGGGGGSRRADRLPRHFFVGQPLSRRARERGTRRYRRGRAQPPPAGRSGARDQDQAAALGVFQVLRSDAGYLAEAMTRNQALALGIADPEDGAAIWTQTEEGQEKLRRERQEWRERFQKEWGRAPGW